GGAGTGVEPLRTQLRSRVRRGLCRRLLQLQVGGGARSGCLRRVRGKRRLRSGHRTALPGFHPGAGRQPRCARGVRGVPRAQAGYRPAAPPARHRGLMRAGARRARITARRALIVALVLVAGPLPAVAESRYITEQLTVGVYSEPEGGGERVALLKSGEQV